MRTCATVHLILLLFTVFAKAQQHVEKRLEPFQVSGLSKESNTNYFLVVGDWGRNGQGDQQSVADWMGVAANQVNARFVISTGDNFYCCGVASTLDYQWMVSFEQVYRSHSLQIPWYCALGNHDYQGNVQAQLDYSKVSQRWKMPSRYFTLVLNSIRFIFIDTSPFIKEYRPDRSRKYGDLAQQDTTRQLQWVDSLLSSSKEDRKIVVGHHPLYSAGAHGNDPDIQRIFEKRFEKYHVNAYIAGHDHSLQRLKPKTGHVQYIISGGGSEHTTVNDKHPNLLFAKGTSGFLVIGAGERMLKIYYMNEEGKILFEESITN